MTAYQRLVKELDEQKIISTRWEIRASNLMDEVSEWEEGCEVLEDEIDVLKRKLNELNHANEEHNDLKVRHVKLIERLGDREERIRCLSQQLAELNESADAWGLKSTCSDPTDWTELYMFLYKAEAHGGE